MRRCSPKDGVEPSTPASFPQAPEASKARQTRHKIAHGGKPNQHFVFVTAVNCPDAVYKGARITYFLRVVKVPPLALRVK